MTTLDAISDMASAEFLEPLGALHEDGETLVLLGPREPGFWAHVTSSPEFSDGAPDPLDRWSERVISALAERLDARAAFPFQKDPYLPFYSWALSTGSLWSSPVQLLVHGRQGLMVSIRGALIVPERIPLPAREPSPCEACATQPCRTACPVDALTEAGYDVDACHAYLNTPDGADCLQNGCQVRLSCPVSASYGRLRVQSAYHMAQFHR